MSEDPFERLRRVLESHGITEDDMESYPEDEVDEGDEGDEEVEEPPDQEREGEVH